MGYRIILEWIFLIASFVNPCCWDSCRPCSFTISHGQVLVTRVHLWKWFERSQVKSQYDANKWKLVNSAKKCLWKWILTKEAQKPARDQIRLEPKRTLPLQIFRHSCQKCRPVQGDQRSKTWRVKYTQAVNCVALSTRVTSQLWTCVKYVPNQSFP